MDTPVLPWCSRISSIAYMYFAFLIVAAHLACERIVVYAGPYPRCGPFSWHAHVWQSRPTCLGRIYRERKVRMTLPTRVCMIHALTVLPGLDLQGAQLLKAAKQSITDPPRRHCCAASMPRPSTRCCWGWLSGEIDGLLDLLLVSSFPLSVRHHGCFSTFLAEPVTPSQWSFSLQNGFRS